MTVSLFTNIADGSYNYIPVDNGLVYVKDVDMDTYMSDYNSSK